MSFPFGPILAALGANKSGLGRTRSATTPELKLVEETLGEQVSVSRGNIVFKKAGLELRCEQGTIQGVVLFRKETTHELDLPCGLQWSMDRTQVHERLGPPTGTDPFVGLIDYYDAPAHELEVQYEGADARGPIHHLCVLLGDNYQCKRRRSERAAAGGRPCTVPFAPVTATKTEETPKEPKATKGRKKASARKPS